MSSSVRTTITGALLAVALLGPSVDAQVAVAKGQQVGVKIPAALFVSEGASMSGVPIFAADVVGAGPAVRVAGRQSWQSEGFPFSWTFNVEKISTKKGFTEVELRNRLAWLKLRFYDQDLHSAFAAVTTPDPIQYLTDAYAILASSVFSGPLGSLTAAQRVEFMRHAHLEAGAVSVQSEVYKDNHYVVADLGRDTSVYNDLQFSQASLVAHVLNEDLLKKLKGFAAVVRNGVFGVKLEFKVPHMSFLDKKSPAPTYELHIYAPATEIIKFSEADVTNQEFVDSCVILVDGSRVKVSLAGEDNEQ